MMKIRFISFLLACLFVVSLRQGAAQTQTTAELSGIVTDNSGAVIVNADISVLRLETGMQRTARTNRDGYYSIPLLPPGSYSITVKANGFQTSARDGVPLSIDQSARVDFKLGVGSVSTQVEVESDSSLIETSNPNTTTTVTEEQLENLPNPGQDLTYAATVAPGAIMNVNSSNGYNGGNVEFSGLPSISNDFTIDGMDANDAWQSLNRSGASGLMLGLNAIQEASINTQSYSTDLGRMGGSQINYITKSGTNSFHGNAYEIWNGSSMNTTNYFIKANPNPPKKPFSNTNEFGASVGGPVLKSKLFFFTDLEGIRIVLPQILSATLPSPDYQKYVLAQLPVGGYDSVLGMALPGQPGEVSLYNSLFSLLPDTSKGTPLSIEGCPFDVGGGAPVAAGAGNGCGNQLLRTASPPVSETLSTTKVDYALNSRDTVWVRFQFNSGSNTRVDAVNTAFNILDNEPERGGSANWTHIFGPNLVNQFSPGISYQNRVHTLQGGASAAALPIAYSPSSFTSIGGALGNIPYGDKTTTWQLNDDLSWTIGRHVLKLGENFRRNLYSSYESEGYAVIPFVDGCSLAEFTYGATCSTYQAFPTYGVDHLAAYSLDSYVMDVFKLTKTLTLTGGLRLGLNSNPVSHEGVISRLVEPFRALTHDLNQPINRAVAANQHKMFTDTYPLTWGPRAALAWEFYPKSVLRAGAGVFSNPLMGFLPSYMDENAPSDDFFQAGIFEPLGGLAIVPGVPGSAIDAAVQANQAFQAGFANSVVSCVAANAPSNCLPTVNFTNFESKKQKFPTIYQWSLGIEQQLGKSMVMSVKYVGTHASNMFYSDSPNGYQTLCEGCFKNYPYNTPPDARFGDIFPFENGANSSYNALQTTVTKRASKGLSFQANYTWSHCLDFISNGGVEVFNANENFDNYNGRLGRLHGNCDFDVRNSLNGAYLYQLPFQSTRGFLNPLVSGWAVSGNVYVRGGFPFSALSSTPGGGFVNAYPTLFANVIPGQAHYAKQAIGGVTQPGTKQWVNPNAFRNVTDTSTNGCYPVTNPMYCQDGNSARNLLRAPGFNWFDFDVMKRFTIRERLKLRLDSQIYNVFNHPNFGFPNGAYGSPGNVTAGIPGEIGTLAGFGNINTTVGPSTGLLGGGLGGDSSVRMIALRIGLEF